MALELLEVLLLELFVALERVLLVLGRTLLLELLLELLVLLGRALLLELVPEGRLTLLEFPLLGREVPLLELLGRTVPLLLEPLGRLTLPLELPLFGTGVLLPPLLLAELMLPALPLGLTVALGATLLLGLGISLLLLHSGCVAG